MNHSRRLWKVPAATACLLLCLVAVGCNGVGRKTILGAPGVGAAPTVTGTSPVPGAANVLTTSLLTVTFSESMATASLTPASVSVECPTGTPVAAAVAYNAATDTETVTPLVALPFATLCTATVTTIAESSMGFPLAADYVWNFTTINAPSVAPQVILTIPANGATNLPTNTRINAVFDMDMDAATITAASVTVVNTTLGTPVAGVVTYVVATRTAVFTPTAPATLPTNTLLTATITTAAADTGGTPLAADFIWTFTTGALADTIRPTVVLTVPLNTATAVATNTLVSAVFSEDMDPTTIKGANFTVVNTTLGSPVTGTVAYHAGARSAVFTPTAALAANTLFTATITSAAADLAGNGLAGDPALLPAASNYIWTFSSGAATDTTPPTVTLVSPLAGATIVCRTKTVSATFTEAMDPATINTTTFRVTAAGIAVLGTVSYDALNHIAQFTVTAPTGFAASTLFTATVKSGAAGVKDVAGNALAADHVWTFTTGTTACTQPVNLGTAAGFGSFGGSAGITNQGINTVVNGNMATTAACTLVTGFHDALNVYTQTPLNVGVVNGSIDCAPPAPGTAATAAAATQALLDAQLAYNYLAALPPGSDPGAGELGGLTLTPATYTSAAGTFGITSGDLTLDAQGDPNAQWVFQMASSLTVGLPATPRHVLLVNGALAKNVFWQVGAAARVEDGSAMVGTIISSAGVTISTAGQTIQTTLTGRVLSLVASVTMVNTTIIAP
ncbi:MAG: Ig-like domain-containing protein [Gammaproteobacteria bacterium]